MRHEVKRQHLSTVWACWGVLLVFGTAHVIDAFVGFHALQCLSPRYPYPPSTFTLSRAPFYALRTPSNALPHSRAPSPHPFHTCSLSILEDSASMSASGSPILRLMVSKSATMSRMCCTAGAMFSPTVAPAW